jgi:hypothetical protein
LDDSDAFIADHKVTISTGFAAGTKLSNTTNHSVSLASVLFEIKPRSAFFAEGIEASFSAALISILESIGSTESISGLIITELTKIALAIELIGGASFDKSEWDAIILDSDLAKGAAVCRDSSNEEKSENKIFRH